MEVSHEDVINVLVFFSLSNHQKKKNMRQRIQIKNLKCADVSDGRTRVH